MTFENKCPICGRVAGNRMEYHHLKPVTFRTRTKEVHEKDNKILIHPICHRKLHSAITELEMLHHYHSVARLLEHDEIRKFIKWVENRAPDFYVKTKETKERKNKRRR